MHNVVEVCGCLTCCALLITVLNFIPNIGSMLAMMAPIPLVIVDPNLATWQKVLAFAGPGVVQGYVGNILEPVSTFIRAPQDP